LRGVGSGRDCPEQQASFARARTSLEERIQATLELVEGLGSGG
jgi:hypothetical protein